MRKVNKINIPSLDKARLRNKDSLTFVYSSEIDENLKSRFENKKFFIRTYGCQANIRDEEIMSGILVSLGMERTEDKNLATIAILNTCAVRENAEDKVYGEIGEFKALKNKNKDLILCICGCMIEQNHIIDFILSTYPFVDIMFGTHNIQDLAILLKEYLKKNEIIIDVESKVGDIYEELPSKRNSTFKAFVNISYGCNKFCTYCIVPYTRGKERSRKMEDILKECKELVDANYQEITLLGQNVDSYGNDGSTLQNYLKKLLNLEFLDLDF